MATITVVPSVPLTFQDLTAGEVFHLSGSDPRPYYMKMAPPLNAPNAVNVENGTCFKFTPTMLVERVNCTIRVQL